MILERRGFLKGSLALFAAPAIVKATSLMPISTTDIYNTRYMVTYDIGTDRMVLQVDRALHALPLPNGIIPITPEHAHKIIPQRMIFALRPAAGVQQNISAIIPHGFRLS